MTTNTQTTESPKSPRWQVALVGAVIVAIVFSGYVTVGRGAVALAESNRSDWWGLVAGVLMLACGMVEMVMWSSSNPFEVFDDNTANLQMEMKPDGE